jgi:SAM-dependent methyltransferase
VVQIHASAPRRAEASDEGSWAVRRPQRESPVSSADTEAVLEEYGKLAPHYDRRWSFYVERTLRETLSRLELRAGESLLDVGCGTGMLLEALSISVPDAKLSGVDPSPEMLEVARKRLDAAVILEESHAESLPFPDASFDVVVSASAFHYFRDPLGALEEMARVLRPNGRLVVTDWCDDYVVCRICDLWLRLFGRGHFRIYGEKQCRQFLEKAGFTDVRVDRYKINWLWGLMTAVARARAAETGDEADPPTSALVRPGPP